MREYYGLFKDLKNFYMDSIEDIGIYENEFARVYSLIVGGNYEGEIDFYVQSALQSGKDVLEIACGDGKRVMIPMAKLGFNVDGVEISKDMIEVYKEYSKRLPQKLRSNIKIYESDIFTFHTNKKYDLITIPATTICLLSDDEEKTISLFNRLYDMLKDNGRLAFDYRTGQIMEKNASELNHLIFKSNGEKTFVLFQEFNNYIKGRTVVNFYMQKDTESKTKKYLTSSNKKIISEEFIERILNRTKFKRDNHLDISLGTNAEKVRMISLKK